MHIFSSVHAHILHIFMHKTTELTRADSTNRILTRANVKSVLRRIGTEGLSPSARLQGEGLEKVLRSFLELQKRAEAEFKVRPPAHRVLLCCMKSR